MVRCDEPLHNPKTPKPLGGNLPQFAIPPRRAWWNPCVCSASLPCPTRPRSRGFSHCSPSLCASRAPEAVPLTSQSGRWGTPTTARGRDRQGGRWALPGRQRRGLRQPCPAAAFSFSPLRHAMTVQDSRLRGNFHSGASGAKRRAAPRQPVDLTGAGERRRRERCGQRARRRHPHRCPARRGAARAAARGGSRGKVGRGRPPAAGGPGCPGYG